MWNLSLVALILALASCKTTSNVAESDILSEADDRTTEFTALIVDTDEILEEEVNRLLDVARKETESKFFPAKWTPEAVTFFMERAYFHVAENARGSGLKFGWRALSKEASQHTKIEHWLENHLDPAKNQIVRLKFKNSKYGVNPVGIISGRVKSHKTMKFANHSIAATVRNQGVLLGLDKWGHFFQMGYWYWHEKLTDKTERDEYAQYMEGDSELPKEKRGRYRAFARQWISTFQFGYFGSWSTGVVSRADMVANEAGYHFWKKLAENPATFKFRVADYADLIPMMNEANNPNKYTSGVEIDTEIVKPNVDKSIFEIVSAIKRSEYKTAAEMADRKTRHVEFYGEELGQGEVNRMRELQKAAYFYFMTCAHPEDDFSDVKPSDAVVKAHNLPATVKFCDFDK